MRSRLLVLAVALALAGCGEEPEPDAQQRRAEVVAELADDLVTETGGALDEHAAACVADRLVDAVGVDRLDDIVTAAGGGGDDALRDQVIDVFASCDALEQVREG